MQADSDIPLNSLLDDALLAARHVSSSVGLLSDLYGEVGIARHDADASNLARTLDMVREQAERVGILLEKAAGRAQASAPDARPSPAAVQRHHRSASVQR